MTANLPANTQQGGMPIVGKMPTYMQELAAQSSMGSFGDGFSGSRRVQLKGGQINFLAEDGKPMGTVASSDGTIVAFPQYTNSAEIIILGIAPEGNTTYRTMYLSQYKDGDSLPPDCWSADGVHPSPKSFAKQSDACASCPKNVAGTSSTGKGKACGSRKRLVVVFAHDPEMRLFSMDLSSTALFGTSARAAAGYFTLSEYAKLIKQNGAIWEGLVTEVCFSEGANIGVRFKAKAYVEYDKLQQLLQLGKTAESAEMLTIDFPERKADNEAPAAQAYVAADPKSVMLANPAFQTTLAHLRDWAQHPSVTIETIRAEAAKYGVAL
jgi:hypothetical protein